MASSILARRHFLGAALGAVATAGCNGEVSWGDPIDPPVTDRVKRALDQLDGQVRAQMRRTGVPGVEIGRAHVSTPVTPDSRFPASPRTTTATTTFTPTPLTL